MAAISIIIPCYNVESYIDRCLTSITSQTIDLSLLEIICIDDASTDNTWRKLQAWEAAFPDNIMIIHCEENGRQGKARNIGLQYSSTPWVAFIDSDDWVELDYFEKLYTTALKTNSDVVISQTIRDSSTELSFLSERQTGKEERCLLIDTLEKRKLFIVLKSMDSLACGKLIRKSLLIDNQIYFPENLTYEDTYLSSMLHLYTQRVYFLEERLYHYFINQHSTVLQTDSDHHLDLLTVQIMLWNQWKTRGLFDTLREELEYEFLHSCYLRFLKIIVFRYQTPSYSLFNLLQNLIRERIPNYSENSYLQQIEQPEFYQILFQAISLPMNKDTFKDFAQHIKKIGI